MMKIKYALYLIVDHTQIGELKKIIDHGVTCVQLRIKNQSFNFILSVAKELMALLKPRNIPLIINDYVEIAKKVDAQGVHIGQCDRSYKIVRQQLGYKKSIGVSIRTIEEAYKCRFFDCDYFGVGPVFTTTTKTDAGPAIGINKLKKIALLLAKPAIAIGGINKNTIHPLLTLPIVGVALSAGIFSSRSPQQTTQYLSQLISEKISYENQL